MYCLGHYVELPSLNYYSLGRWLLFMEGRICFEYRWGLKPVLVYALCHPKPIFYFDYHNKRFNTPNNMSSRKRSNTYWSTNMSLLKRSNMYWPINMSSLKSSNMYWSNNMPLRISSNMHWLHQYATKFNVFTKHIEIHIVLSKVWSLSLLWLLNY